MNMRCLRSLVLLVCVCSSVLFSNSLPVHAEDTETDTDLEITYNPNDWVYIDPNTPMVLDESVMIESVVEYGSSYWRNGSQWWYNYVLNSFSLPAGTYSFMQQLRLSSDIPVGTYDVTLTFQAPHELNLAPIINSMVIYGYGNGDNSSSIVSSKISATSIQKSTNDSTNTLDVYKIQFKDFEVTDDLNLLRIEYSITLDSEMDVQFIPYHFNFKTIDESTGLLKSIIEFLKNIVSGITELPSNIASAIKGLFVPSEDDLTSYFDKWKALLSDRFGALYEVFDIIVDYFDTFSNNGSQSVVMFPSVTVPLAGSDFVFGGWEVSLVPTGFTVVFDALKLMINVLCTVAFVNALRKRYDRLVER